MPTSVRIVKKNETFGLINIIAIIVLIAIFGFGGHFIGRYERNKKVTSTQISGVQTFAYEGENGKTAMDLLKSKAKVETTDSSFGSFVVSINAVPNSTDHFWMFYVNGELASTGADQYQTKEGDKIEWRYEKL